MVADGLFDAQGFSGACSVDVGVVASPFGMGDIRDFLYFDSLKLIHSPTKFLISR